jgi:SAM-dependent methyltransferase
MLDSAKRRLSLVQNVEFLSAPIHATGLPTASIDVAACFLVLHHHTAPKLALTEMRRLLRAARGGGMALVVDMVRHDRGEYRRMMGHEHLGFGKDELVPMMKDAGFERVEYRELPAEPDAKGPGLFAAVGWIGAE